MADNINSKTDSGIASIDTISNLRTFEPITAGQFIRLREYTKGTGTGGGVFVHDVSDKISRDDGGVIIVTSKGARWKRFAQDPNNLSVMDFGAIGDGRTDCLDAVKKMFDWSQSNFPSLGIRFPAGKFMISSFDISPKQIDHFKISGAPLNFGYFPTTFLYSDEKKNSMFTVNSRYVEISGLVIDGGCGNTDIPSNEKGFFRNIISGGQFLRVSCMEFRNVGGRCLDILDTLDCKIDQFYARNCCGSVIWGAWSDQKAGAWDHMTAVELSNFNIQSQKRSPVFHLPRCTQSFIHNGWIEHSDNPGNLSQGGWVIEGLAIESTQKKLNLYQTRALIIQKSINNNAPGFEYDTQPDNYDGYAFTDWSVVSEFDRGVMEISDHGAIIQGTLSYDVITSQQHMDNRTDKEQWFYVGQFNFGGATTQIHLRVQGTSQYLSQSETQSGYSERSPEGASHIYLQETNSGVVTASWYGEGVSPLTSVHIEGSSTHCDLYVKVARYTGFVSVFAETNGKDRFQSGICFKYRKKFELCNPETIRKIESAAKVAFEQHWTGNSRVGYGYNDVGEVLLQAPVFDRKYQLTDGKSVTRHFVKVRLNGKSCSLEVLPEDGASGS